MKHLRNADFIENITILIFILGICFMGLIRIKKNEVYCKIEENQNKWNCITLGDLVGDKE